MTITGKSIRTFIGSADFDVSRRFYRELGFQEYAVAERLSYFRIDQFGFYLQNYYVKEWVENSMVFFEVDNLECHLKDIAKLRLPDKYKNVRLSEIHYNEWGNEFFLHDPSGVLWHFGEFVN